jgi:hypothetical protein
MKNMPEKLKELQQQLRYTDFAFVPSGKRTLANEVYPAVEDKFPRLCSDNTKCSQVCGGSDALEWKHRVRTVLHSLADDPESRVLTHNDRGMWRFK